MSWSGSRDEEGYATGPGTLTYYRVNWQRVTGSNIPTGKPIVARRLSGKMAKGKFVGMVEMTTAEGATTHAKFANGLPGGKWIGGLAPDATKSKAVAQQDAPKEEATLTGTPAPAPAEGPAVGTTLPEVASSPAPAAESQRPAGSDVLRSLTGPPSSLPKSDPRLSRADVIRAADEEAISRGFNVGDYPSRKLSYDSAGTTWTVSYSQPPGNGGPADRKHFAIKVEDKTSKATVTPDE